MSSPSLARAFWFWFVAGSLAFPTLAGVAVVALAEHSRTLTVAAGFLLLLGTPLYALAAGVLVWRSGRVAAPGPRWLSRAVVLASLGVLALGYAAVAGVHTDMRLRAAVAEATARAHVARAAIGVACAQGRLSAGMTHAALGIDSPVGFENRWLHRLETEVRSMRDARIVVTLKAWDGGGWQPWRAVIEDGATIEYDGRCTDGVMAWSVGGTLDARHAPKP